MLSVGAVQTDSRKLCFSFKSIGFGVLYDLLQVEICGSLASLLQVEQTASSLQLIFQFIYVHLCIRVLRLVFERVYKNCNASYAAI